MELKRGKRNGSKKMEEEKEKMERRGEDGEEKEKIESQPPTVEKQQLPTSGY